MNKTWSDSEKEFIKRNAGTLKDVDIARQLSAIVGRPVSLQAVRKQRQKLGLAKKSGRGLCALIGQAAPPITPGN